MIHDYDTLAYHKKERPGVLFRSLKGVALNEAGPWVRKSLNGLTSISPEREAISFYLLNHAMAEIETRFGPDDPLGDALGVVERYHAVLNDAGIRMFGYLLITTTRESRHLKNGQENQLASKHGTGCTDFTKKVKSHSQDALYTTKSQVTMGAYLDYLCDVYNTLGWSSAYGGPNWGKVTQPLRDVVHGDISIEMMLDVAYTLAHNNGPIFNKGFQYAHYDMTSLMTILDCQRAGQIPNMVRAQENDHVSSNHLKALDEIEKRLPGFKAKKWVNWEMVEKLGAVGSYSGKKAQTMQKFKHDPEFQEEQKDVLAAIEVVKQAAADKKALEEKHYIEILPGVKLKKEEKVR